MHLRRNRNQLVEGRHPVTNQAINNRENLENAYSTKMDFGYDSGYESCDENRIRYRDVIAGDHDDMPLDQLVQALQ